MSAEAGHLQAIRDSAKGLVPPGDLKRIRALRFQSPGYDPAVLRQMAELGWIGLRVREEDGGIGLGVAELCALAEELGAGLVPEPLIQAAIVAPLLSGTIRDAVLAGETLVLPAWQERPDTLEVGTETTLHDRHISGMKVFVPGAAGAGAFLVAAQGSLAVVDADAPGLSVETLRTQDGGHYGTLRFDNTPTEAVPGALDAALEEAALATAAYLLGVMERAQAITLDYLRTRKQFGRPIGSFQALQHRAADLSIQVALTRASVESAAATLDSDASPSHRRAAVSRAKARASEAAMLVTRQAIQLHGGIGYTDEYDVGLYLRKAMVLANAYGSAAWHRARFAALTPEEE